MTSVSDWERFYLWAWITTVYGACIWWMWKDVSEQYRNLEQRYHRLQDEHIALLLERAQDSQEDATTILSEAEEHEN